MKRILGWWRLYYDAFVAMIALVFFVNVAYTLIRRCIEGTLKILEFIGILDQCVITNNTLLPDTHHKNRPEIIEAP
jgi:hypothetical protein